MASTPPTSSRAARVPAPFIAVLAVAVAGVLAPMVVMVMLMTAPAVVAPGLIGGPVLAVGLMGAGMIGAAADGRFWVGVVLAVLAGAGLLLIARVLGMPALPHPFSTALAILVASFSFAARGVLFARSAADKGWRIAIFVVAGEAAMLFVGSVSPGTLPSWLLVLLPAQWTSVAIQTALAGTGTRPAASVLIALAGTGAITLLVARLWPRRWPYALMFAAWLGLSALVWYCPAPPAAYAGPAIASAPDPE